MQVYVGLIRITLLSNMRKRRNWTELFETLKNYTTLKPVADKWDTSDGLRPLKNYTTLKHAIRIYIVWRCLRPLKNYTTLKLDYMWSLPEAVWDP